MIKYVIFGIIWNIWLSSTFVTAYKHDKLRSYLPNTNANGCYQVYKKNAFAVYRPVKTPNGFVCFNTLKELPAHE